jgi:sodium-dependent dicarboxylate transporter 2/3/5
MFPKKEKTPGQFARNLFFLLFFLLLLPLIFLNETLKEIQVRLKLRPKGADTKLDRLVRRSLDYTWYPLFREKGPPLKEQNPRTYISINRLIYDLPFFGLLFMGLVVLVIYFLLKLGDNPATPQMDGHIFRFLNDITNQTIPYITNLFLFLLVVVLLSIFVTEVVNNTTVVLILFPIITQICLAMDLNPLFLLMAVSIASTGAFMTPVATSVNAIAYASIAGVSLRRMLKLGFILNLLSGVWITLLFHFINKL